MISERYSWVKEMLETQPDLRDSNEKLYFRYLQHLGYNIYGKNIQQFLKDMANREIPYIDVIGRASRKVQEENPELRGKYYNKRKTKKEPEVRSEVRKLR